MKNKDNDTPSTTPVFGDPDTCTEIVNKYGTYNIQPTADSDHDFPAIAQALSKKEKRRYERERRQWEEKKENKSQRKDALQDGATKGDI